MCIVFTSYTCVTDTSGNINGLDESVLESKSEVHRAHSSLGSTILDRLCYAYASTISASFDQGSVTSRIGQ